MHWSLWILVGFAAWVLAGFIVAPFIGQWLCRKADEQSRPVEDDGR